MMNTMNQKYFYIFILLICSVFQYCEKEPTAIEEQQNLTDIDGNIYQIIKIGEQWWMSENLKVIHYRNGDAIQNIIDNTLWSTLTTGAYCNYFNDTNNVAIYGRLYNWYAIEDNRKIAPIGWHIPTDDDWKELEMFLGMSQSDVDLIFRGTDEGAKLKETGITHWMSPNTGATNTSGFTALPGGNRHIKPWNYSQMGRNTFYWSETESFSTMNDSMALGRRLDYNNSRIFRYEYPKKTGFSIRCLKD